MKLQRSVAVLIVGTLVALAFLRGDSLQWALVAWFSLFVTWTIIRALLKKRQKEGPLSQQFQNRIQGIKRSADKPKTHADSSRSTVSPPEELNEPDSIREFLVLQVNARITEKLQSVYPDVSWKWLSPSPVDVVLNAGTGQIQTSNTDEFNLADVVFDSRGGIRFKMVRSVPLENMTASNTQKEEAKAGNSQIIDLSAWFNLAAEEQLNEAITDMNTRGHNCLYISADGVITSKTGEEEDLPPLSHMPPQNYWPTLVKVLNQEENLHAEIDNDRIRLSWAA